MNRRGVGTPRVGSGEYPTTGPLGALGLIQSVTPLAYWHGDLGVSEADAAGRVRQWNDQVGSAHWLQATANAQPGLGTGVLNGHNVVSGDGSGRFMAATIALAPPLWVLAVFRQNSWAATSRLIGGSATTQFKIGGAVTTPNMNINNGSAGPTNSGAVIGSWFRLRAFFNNSTSDYLLIGSTNATGVATGSDSTASLGLFAISSGANFGAFSLAMLGLWNGEPTSAELASTDSWVTTEFGGTVGL